MTEIERANRTADDLVEKLAAAEDRRAVAEASAAEVSFSAHTGNLEARQALDRFNAEAMSAEVEARSLAVAVKEAKRRVGVARGVAAREAQRITAQEVYELASRLPGLAGQKDAGLAQAKDSDREIDRVFLEIRKRGGPTPTTEQVRVNSERAFDATGVDPRAEWVSPLRRRSFVELHTGWAQMPMNWASRILDEPAPADEKPERAA